MTDSLALVGASVGAGLSVVGAGAGIGRLAASYMEGTARQPAASGELRTGLLIGASFIEGLGMLALLICLLSATHG
jgi:F-type H+-transporting ATPase subunit c